MLVFRLRIGSVVVLTCWHIVLSYVQLHKQKGTVFGAMKSIQSKLWVTTGL